MLPSSLHSGSVSVKAFSVDTRNTHRYTQHTQTHTTHTDTGNTHRYTQHTETHATHTDTRNAHRHTQQDDSMTLFSSRPQADATTFCHLKIHI